MTTLSRAMRLEDQDTRVNIACRIVCIKLFRTRRTVQLTVVFIDRDGRSFEAISWSANKAYFVHFNFKENQNVFLHCLPSSFTDIEPSFSQAELQVSDKHWSLSPNKNEFIPKNYFPVRTDIVAFHKSPRPCKSMLAVFVELGQGPLKYSQNGKLISIGHFVKFRDFKNRLFQMLTWEHANKKFKFPLNDCKEGDLILLPYAREVEEQYRSPNIYSIKSIYPPVVSPKTINVSKAAAFKNYSDNPSETYNPYK